MHFSWSSFIDEENILQLFSELFCTYILQQLLKSKDKKKKKNYQFSFLKDHENAKFKFFNANNTDDKNHCTVLLDINLAKDFT